MIIKGGAAGNTGFWSKHLKRDDTNDRAEVMQISGLLSSNLPDALREMEAIADQSRSGGNFMYQANINPGAGERLTEAQWKEAVDTLENYLGLAGHQRVVVEHEKEGRVHRHVIWNRVDVHTLRVTDIGGNYYTHERVARALEIKFDMQRTASLHGERRPEGRPERAPELSEKRAAGRSGIDQKQIKTEITDLWRSTDSGKALAAALEARGYILAQGDRRNFCIVDQAGDAHSLARRIEGAKAKDVRERLADIDPGQLPTVDQARTAQRERYPTREAARTAWEGRAGAEATHTPEQAQTATQEPQKSPPEAKRDQTAQQEPHRPEPRHAKAPSNPTPEQQTEKVRDDAATIIEARIFHIQDAAERGGASVTAALHRDGVTLARVDAAGKTQSLADLAEGELVAVTRGGGIHRLNPRYINIEALERAAMGGTMQAPPLSAALEFFAPLPAQVRTEQVRPEKTDDHISEKNTAREDFRAAAKETIADKREAPRARHESAKDIKEAALTVTDTATGTVTTLSSFVEKLMNLVGGGPVLTEGDIIARQRRALAAMENIQESIERGDSLSASDIQNLTPTHIENLYRGGDEYMRQLVNGLGQGTARDYDYSRSRDFDY